LTCGCVALFAVVEGLKASSRHMVFSFVLSSWLAAGEGGVECAEAHVLARDAIGRVREIACSMRFQW